MTDFDVILVGGGLSASLIAHRLVLSGGRGTRTRVLIVEAADTLCGNHTWSFHATDVSAAQDQWLGPLTSVAWPEQATRFPHYERTLDIGYRAIASRELAAKIAARDEISIITGARATTLGDDHVVLAGGQSISAPCVIDCRGAVSAPALTVGFQKFVGLEVELIEPHRLARPIIMDARVTQIDGYRFVYLLPFSPTRLLVEDTYYADRARLDVDEITKRIDAYIADAGWRVRRVERTETGVLPIVLDGALDDVWASDARIARAGMRAGLFHQTTGYSLPLGAETADRLAAVPILTTASAHATIRGLAEATWREQRYFRMLNRTMFVAPEALKRRRIFERFYTLGPGLIGRFFAGRLRARDKVRLLTGKPPVPMLAAFRSFHPASARVWAEQRDAVGADMRARDGFFAAAGATAPHAMTGQRPRALDANALPPAE
ncbi:MAG: lycopene beta-cyclase CrtY [Pseudomonadota bacterium]